MPMSDELISLNDKREQLSLAYVSAVASKAGYSISNVNLDRDSIDITVSSGSSRRASVAFQLKATSSPEWIGDELCFQLKKKNFNDLAIQRQVPLLLLVMELPASESDWLLIDENRLQLKKCCWYLSLEGRPKLEDQKSKVVRIPKENAFSVSVLKSLIAQSNEGKL